MGIISHALESVGKCEGMNLHTPKWAPTLGVGVTMDSQIFKEWLQGTKRIGLKRSLYHWKALGMQMSKMDLHDPFGHVKHKLWPKEGPRFKLPIWLSTTKSLESPQFPCVEVSCDISLKRFQQRLHLFLKSHLNWRSANKVMGPQNHERPNCGNFETPIWESRKKWHLGVGPVAKHRVYYKEESDGFPQVRAMMNLVSLCLPVARPCTKMLQLHTNQLVVWFV
jgi:hypothetical protein